MDLATEKVVLTVPASRGSKEIGHTGGTLRFDGEGNLCSRRRRRQPVRASRLRADRRAARARTSTRQGTSANTNDLRGKLLRIKPEPTARYTIPAGNLFAPGEMGTRPEIYAMGFRNAFRFTVDTDRLGLHRRLRPRRRQPNPNRGPAGLVEWNVIKAPGNYGWPYCVADNVAYNDFDFATSTSGAKFNCARAGQRLPQQHGQARPAAVDRVRRLLRLRRLADLAAARPGSAWRRWPAPSTTTTRLAVGHEVAAVLRRQAALLRVGATASCTRAARPPTARS